MNRSARRQAGDRRGFRSTGWLWLLDLLVLGSALGCALMLAVLRSTPPPPTPSALPSWPVAVLLVPMSLALIATFGLYRPGLLRLRRRQAGAGARVVIWSAALSVGSIFLLAQEIPADLRALVLVYHATLAVWALGARPLIVSSLRARSSRGEQRILIYGRGRNAKELAHVLTRRHRGAARIVAFADDRRPDGIDLQPFQIADLNSLPEVAEAARADLVVVARDELSREEIVRLSDAMVIRGIRVKVLSNVLDSLIVSLPLEEIRGFQLLQVGESPLRGGAQRLKRGIDLVGAVLGGLLILPLLVAIACAIKLTSKGPIFFEQRRIGRGGVPFVFYKFRSMVVHQPDEDHRRYLEAFLKSDAAACVDVNGKKVYKLTDDPRVTSIGRLLRRTSLDELPQLWNVIRGEMSLIGPRPCLPFEYELYDEWQRRRLDVTPGMTGLWQVTGRSYVTFNDMVLLDLFYIGNWSLALDAKLLLRTLPVILFGKGGL